MTDDILDDALVCAEEVFSEFINDNSCNSKIFGILEKLGRNDGFTYNISYDNSGKVTGIVWMTSIMRSNLERYSSSICLDAMKRKTNVHLWPYMAIALVDELGRVCVGCEALCIQERHEAYQFVISSAFQMAPNVSPQSIKSVFSDEFITLKLLDTVGLGHAKLFFDHYHLKDNCQKFLGADLYKKYETHINAVFYSKNETDFNTNISFLCNTNTHTTKLADLAHELKGKRDHFAKSAKIYKFWSILQILDRPRLNNTYNVNTWKGGQHQTATSSMPTNNSKLTSYILINY